MSRSTKIRYDFPTERLLEISFDNSTWYRVTCSMFRSFNGPRRIDYVPYTGKTYYQGTNTEFTGRTKKPRTILITKLNAKRKKQVSAMANSRIKPNKNFI